MCGFLAGLREGEIGKFLITVRRQPVNSAGLGSFAEKIPDRNGYQGPALIEIETVADRFVRLIIGILLPETSLIRNCNQVRAGGDFRLRSLREVGDGLRTKIRSSHATAGKQFVEGRHAKCVSRQIRN